MKLRKIALILLAVLAFISLPAHAHSGKTDGDGGHTNHSTGEYHYHHGYGEHQHYDIDGDGKADCPLANLKIEKEPSRDDSTNSSKSSTTEKQDRITNTVCSEKPADNKNEKSSKKIKENIENILVFIICVSPFVLPFIIGLCKSIKRR